MTISAHTIKEALFLKRERNIIMKKITEKPRYIWKKQKISLKMVTLIQTQQKICSRTVIVV